MAWLLVSHVRDIWCSSGHLHLPPRSHELCCISCRCLHWRQDQPLRSLAAPMVGAAGIRGCFWPGALGWHCLEMVRGYQELHVPQTYLWGCAHLLV